MSERWLKLTVAYDGTAYAGWQVQPDQLTLQGVLERAWQEITQESVRLTAAGRTDAGVHSLGQVVGVATQSRLSQEELQRGLNAVLPEDIVVLAVDGAGDSFHATHDAVAKRYCYRICDSRTRPLFDRRYVWHFPHALDTAAMHRAGQALVGRHDFASFESAGSERPDTVRTIHQLEVARVDSGSELFRDSFARAEGEAHVAQKVPVAAKPAHGERVVIEIRGDGFLYNMVRAIVGTLVEVGRGTREENWPAAVLAALDRRQAGQTAPPQGLFLVSVDYA